MFKKLFSIVACFLAIGCTNSVSVNGEIGQLSYKVVVKYYVDYTAAVKNTTFYFYEGKIGNNRMIMELEPWPDTDTIVDSTILIGNKMSAFTYCNTKEAFFKDYYIDCDTTLIVCRLTKDN